MEKNLTPADCYQLVSDVLKMHVQINTPSTVRDAIKAEIAKRNLPDNSYSGIIINYLLHSENEGKKTNSEAFKKVFYDDYCNALQNLTAEHREYSLADLCLRLAGLGDLCTAGKLDNFRKTFHVPSPTPPGQEIILKLKPDLTWFRNIYSQAMSDKPILIVGETGTGKELLATAISLISKRRQKTFVPCNCAAIPENLIESELFGYEKGAFSGADRKKRGLFEEADGGTLLLDEIGKMPRTAQAKLLRVLTSKTFTPLGAEKEKTVDVRIIATIQPNEIHANLLPDLLYRLSYPDFLMVPTLKERLAKYPDIPLQAALRNAIRNMGASSDIEISKQAKDILLSRPEWPGNYRELESILNAAIRKAKMNNSKNISANDLGDVIRNAEMFAPANEGNVIKIQKPDTNSMAFEDIEKYADAEKYRILKDWFEAYVRLHSDLSGIGKGKYSQRANRLFKEVMGKGVRAYKNDLHD